MHDSIADAGWRFDNSYARLPEPLFAASQPVPVRSPAVVVVNESLAAELGLDSTILRAKGAGVFAGNEIPPGAEPIAQAYAGHQFGHFTNLGDGRAILLGEQIGPNGRRHDIQLKGAGRTRYSRGGDGRAAIGPMLREYIVSEGMHALGIPTSRSLAVATTGELVLRNSPLAGAVLTRVAASHIRVGTFQFAAAVEDDRLLPALLDHAITRHDPTAAEAADPAVAFFEGVVERQASLIARWMLVGFVHGVMNTDNMAVSGETIDYGPCAFLDVYDPLTVFSSIDQQGRYAYANQPGIAHWNLARLAESLLPLVHGGEEESLEAVRGVLATFRERFDRHYLAGARAKLGLVTEEDGDRDLFATLLRSMHEGQTDFTATFAGLATVAESQAVPAGEAAVPELREWQSAWLARLGRQPGSPAEAATRMRQLNPVVIPRNHRVEEALSAAESGDFAPLHRLLAALRDPFVETNDNERYRGGPPAGCGAYRTFCGT
jgi:serine/tyrosine/threonine adenylyltransferase